MTSWRSEVRALVNPHLKNSYQFIITAFMKSPEQISRLPRQPEEEPISPESYDEAEWEKLKQGYEAIAIIEGRKIGVPQEKLNRFAEDFIAQKTEEQNYELIYRFRKNLKIGTEEQIKAAGEQAYRTFLENGKFGLAMGIAGDVYGRDSEEWKLANERNEADWKKTRERTEIKKEKKVSISKDATFADLFDAIDAIEEDSELGELNFEAELHDNFNSETAEEVLAFHDERASEAATTKILDFFRKHGYSQKDVSAYLPIKFKQERKKE